MDESNRPDKVMVIIQTDGYENASHEFSNDKIKDMIKHQTEKYSWQFIYLGANQDAFSVGSALGINMSFSYYNTSKGTRKLYDTISNAGLDYRMTGSISNSVVDKLNNLQKDDE